MKGYVMTQDELNKLVSEFLPYPSTGQHHALKRFAQIVAEAEREACAKLVEPSADHRANPRDYIAEEQGIELLNNAANKIRARGQQ
jgi:hypothetical protein